MQRQLGRTVTTTQETMHSCILKKHGKLLSLLHKEYCLLETDYSKGGQINPKIQINRVFYAPDGWIIPKSGEQGWKHLISHLIWCYTSGVDKSNSGVLRLRNKQASPPLPSAPPCTKTDIERKHSFCDVSVYLHDRRFTQVEKLFQQEPNNWCFCLSSKKGWL